MPGCATSTPPDRCGPGGFGCRETRRRPALDPEHLPGHDEADVRGGRALVCCPSAGSRQRRVAGETGSRRARGGRRGGARCRHAGCRALGRPGAAADTIGALGTGRVAGRVPAWGDGGPRSVSDVPGANHHAAQAASRRWPAWSLTMYTDHVSSWLLTMFAPAPGRCTRCRRNPFLRVETSRPVTYSHEGDWSARSWSLSMFTGGGSMRRSLRILAAVQGRPDTEDSESGP